MEIKDESILANEAYKYLKAFADNLGRRPVLLIDNMNLVFDRLSKNEQHLLRSLMMKNGAPIIIGGSAVYIEETTDYGAPFYDAFQMHYLEKLKVEELIEILINLARVTNQIEIISQIQKQSARIKALHQLTGGNPRTAVMLFRLIVKGFSKNINDDLEALLDEVTPIYKARFEELSEQMQIIVDAIALHWNPIDLEQLRNITRFENQQLSPQLKRLSEMGWIEKLDESKSKNNKYEMSERFFNIWFLMRRSSRRQKKGVYCLSRFLEAYYGDEINDVCKHFLSSEFVDSRHIMQGLALAKIAKDDKIKEQLHEKSQNRLFDLSKTNPQILEQFEMSDVFKDKNLKSIMDKYDEESEKGNYLVARKLLSESINLTNDNSTKAEIYRLKGLNYTNMLDFDKAELSFKKAVELDANNWINWLALGGFYQGGTKVNFELAEKAYKRAIDIDDNQGMLYYLIGGVYYELNSLDDAENAYKKAVEIDPSNARYVFALAILYHDKFNRHNEVESLCKKAIKLDPTNDTYRLCLGRLYSEELNEDNKAKIEYAKAIAINPNNAEIYLYLGKLNAKLGLIDKAETALKKSINLDDKNAHSHYHLALLFHYMLDNAKEAEIEYKKAIELEKNNPQYTLSLGNLLHYELKYFDEAEKNYKKTIKLDKTLPTPHFELGELYNKSLNQFEKAIKAYRRAIKLDSNDAESYYALGWIYQEHLNEYKEAAKYYEKAIEISPNDTEYIARLGILYHYNLNQLSDAENLYRKAIQIDGEKTKFLVPLAFLYHYDLKQFKEAEMIYKKIVKQENHHYIWNSFANLYKDHLQEFNKAEKAYKKAIEFAENENDIVCSKLNLTSLYRDRLNKIDDAKIVFDTIQFSEDNFPDFYWLNKTLFELYNRNEGIAEEYLEKAFKTIESDGFIEDTQDDWWQFAGVVIRLGYSSWFLNMLKNRELDVILSPYYVAIEALTAKDAKAYLNTVAAEKREAAKDVIEIIRKYM
jgi:tetratricopeptide (TPR) repeat protein